MHSFVQISSNGESYQGKLKRSATFTKAKGGATAREPFELRTTMSRMGK